MEIHMDLFVDSSLTFEKVSAAEVTMPEDPNQWQNEVLQELFKQHPYVADFEPDVVMDRIDAERSFGFGHVDIGNKTEIQSGAGSTGEQVGGIHHVRIPIIIREGKMKPFDTLVTEDSKMLPLTEKRLRLALFRPQMFDVTSRTPGDQSIISTLYPPFRQNYGMGGGGAVTSAGMGKEGGWGILGQILGTISPADFDHFMSKVSDPMMKAAFVANKAATAPALITMGLYEPPNYQQKTAGLAAGLKPTVIQITKTAGGYKLKTASHLMWKPTERLLDRGQLVDLVGVKEAMAIDQAGGATAGDTEVEGDEVPTGEAELIKDFGIYKVTNDKGEELIGYVFPNLIDVTGESVPLALFTNGSQTALQGEIVGVPAGEGVNFMTGHPRGYGTFVQHTQEGLQAMVPMHIETSLGGEARGDRGVGLVATMMDGTQVEILQQPGVAKVTQVDEGTTIVPENFEWMPLNETGTVSLVGGTDEAAEQKEASAPFATVTVRGSDAGVFSVSGSPVEKVASDEREMVGLDDALFVLAGVGVHPAYAMQKLSESIGTHSAVKVKVAHNIQSYEDRMADGRAVFAKIASRAPARHDLVKEASIVPDPMAVDAVLSLGFLNPENIISFVGYLPALNQAQENLCELLIASRMGLRELPEYAIERCIRSLEETIEGLKMLAFQQG
jgi:hypothetical protein